MSKFLIGLIIFGTTIYGYVTSGKGAWQGSWAMFYMLMTMFSGLYVYKRTSLIFSLCYTWMLFQAIGSFMGSKNMSLAPELVVHFDKLSSIFAFGFILMAFVFLHISSKGLRNFEEGFKILCLADSFLVVVQWMTNAPTGGFFINESMNGCFIVMAYPLLAMAPERISYHLRPFKLTTEILFDMVCVFLPILALFCSNASIPIVAMGIVYFCHYLLLGHTIKGLDTIGKKLTLAMAVVGAFVLIGIWKIPNFTNDSGRLNMWRVFIDWFLKEGDLVYGQGAGSFFLLGPYIQTIYKINLDNWYVWSHNEFLQVAMEFGLWGLCLLMALIFEAAYKAFKYKMLHYVLISFIAYCVIAFENFPLRSPVTMLFGCFLLARIYRTDYITRKTYDTKNKNADTPT